jgi:hypothetical protein
LSEEDVFAGLMGGAFGWNDLQNSAGGGCVFLGELDFREVEEG